ncbi:MAG: glycosyltransferase [Maribacter sp.]|nr:glycosyltransferase [Maribacter sp.]
MKQPLVSILMPFKNTAVFLPECLQSILNQEYENWELWAINDHSSDTSLAVVQNFERRDHRIHIVANSGQGIIEALRSAYARCNGNLITRMDSDDVMTSDKLAIMVRLLLHFGEGHLALGQVKYFSENGISDGYYRYEKWLNQLTEKGINFSEIYKECVVPSPCWMAYRQDLESCGAFTSNRYPEDYDLTFRFYEKGLTCIPCDQVLHYWRDYETRTSRTSEHYAQNYFLGIKLYYFLKLDYDSRRSLVIWGAGFKGKTIAKSLIELGIRFIWLCDNPNKIGKRIYGKEMHHYTELNTMKSPQSIISVANDKAQTMIRRYLSGLGQSQGKDYFFFC